jgi:20S proteasome alpha/beta subunit
MMTLHHGRLFQKWLILILSILPFACSVSSGPKNYNAYNYDRTQSQFTPDGRLLQIEYASQAAASSNPIIVLEDQLTGCLILMTIPKILEKKQKSPQQRIVILEDNNDNTLSNPICIAMSGILSDSLALLQSGLQEQNNYILKYNTNPNLSKLAQIFADECHKRAFQGGIRPYGSTLLLCGFDDEEQSLIYQTDPSGGIMQHSFSLEKDSPKSSIVVRCIVGGSQTLQRQLSKNIMQAIDKLDSQKKKQQQQSAAENPTLSDRIAIIASILTYEELSSTASNTNNDKNKNNIEDSADIQLEVVIISPQLGCHRLDTDQLNAVQKLIKQSK